MINPKPEILTALEGNTALTGLLGGKRIYFMKAPHADEFPRITFFEIDNIGALYADDQELGSTIYVQLDIWSKGSTSTIAEEVDETMKTLGYGRSAAADLFEQDTLIFHKAMRYKTLKEG